MPEYDSAGRPILTIDNPQFEPVPVAKSSGAGLGGLSFLAGGALSAGAGFLEGYLNRKEAKRNRDWQERMSNTAHQREVADLRAAGLNPILSAMGGSGSAVPSGSTGDAGDMSGLGESVGHSARFNLERKLADADMARMRAQASAAEAQAANTDMNTDMGKRLIESTILVNKSNARSIDSAREALEKGGAFLGKYLPRTWIESLDDMLRGGAGTGYGGPHKAK